MKLKLCITALLTFMSFNNLMAQTPNYNWAQSFGPDDVIPQSTCTDANGNIYVTGYFANPTITFGAITLTKIGTTFNCFLVKFDASGNAIWAKSLGTPLNPGLSLSNVTGRSICADQNGNVIIAGQFASQLTIGTTTLIPNGIGEAVFIAKYDTTGNVLWAKSEVSPDGGIRYGKISADGNGNVYLAFSSFANTLTIGTQTFTNFFVAALGNNWDIYVVKYDAAGAVVWANQCGGLAEDLVADLSTDAAGNTYLTANCTAATNSSFSTALVFGSFTVQPPLGTIDAFVVKFNASGTVDWVQEGNSNYTGGFSYTTAKGIYADNNGNIAIAGSFLGTTFNLGGVTITNTTGQNFAAFLDEFGNVVWLKGTTALTNNVAIDANGNTIVTGTYSTLTITLGTSTFTNAGGSDPLFFKCDSIGNIIWADATGGTSTDNVTDVTVSSNGDEIIIGSFSSLAIAFGTTTLTNVGFPDMFITNIEEYSANTSLETPNNLDGISFYPNPVVNNLTITNTSGKELMIKLLDVKGKLILEEKVDDSKHAISLSNVDNGIYVLEMQNGNTVSRTKIVKQ